MRTPGHDEELALGFALAEGLSPVGARAPGRPDGEHGRARRTGRRSRRGSRRNFYTSSSCGVCGKGALEAVAVEAPRVESDLRVPAALVRRPAGAAAGGAGRVRGHRRPARVRAVHGRAASSSACARTSGATTRSTRLSAGRSRGAAPATALDRVPERPHLVRARPEGGGGRAARSSSPSARRRRSRSNSPPIAGSRCAASSAAARSTSTRRRGGSRPDGRPAGRRRVDEVRLAEGARPVRRRDARRARLEDARGGVRGAPGGRQGGRARPPVRGARRCVRGARADRRRHRRASRGGARDRRVPPGRLSARHPGARCAGSATLVPSLRRGRYRVRTRRTTCLCSSAGSQRGSSRCAASTRACSRSTSGSSRTRTPRQSWRRSRPRRERAPKRAERSQRRSALGLPRRSGSRNRRFRSAVEEDLAARDEQPA